MAESLSPTTRRVGVSLSFSRQRHGTLFRNTRSNDLTLLFVSFGSRRTSSERGLQFLNATRRTRVQLGRPGSDCLLYLSRPPCCRDRKGKLKFTQNYGRCSVMRKKTGTHLLIC